MTSGENFLKSSRADESSFRFIAAGDFTNVQGLPQSYIAATAFDVTAVPGPVHERGPGLELGGAPNPFRGSAQIRFRLPEPAVVSLSLFDVSGRSVATLIDRRSEPAGWHEAPLDGRGLAIGIYFCRLDVGRDSRTVKLLRAE